MGKNDRIEDIVRGALFTEIRLLSDGKSIVMDPETETLYYKKRLSVYSIPVFRFLKENKHKNVPEIHLFWQEEGDLIVIEELIQGQTLDQLLDSGESMSFEEKKRILLELCDALEYLHSATPPIIHRDIKAANVMIREDGAVKLIDYDAAKQYVADKKRDTVLIGTQGVAAPEQYGFGQSDERTDIFAMGKLIERLLPDSVHAMEIAEKATKLQPEMRYPGISEMRRQIERLWDPAISDADHRKQVIAERMRSRTAKRAVIGLAIFTVLAVGLAVFLKFIYPEYFVRKPAYEEGIALMESGEYEKAAEQFEICGKDYRDTEEQMKACSTKLAELQKQKRLDSIREQYETTAKTAVEAWRASKINQKEKTAIEACINVSRNGLDEGETLEAFCEELLQDAMKDVDNELVDRASSTMFVMEKNLSTNAGYSDIMDEKRTKYIAKLEEKEKYAAAADYYKKLSTITKQDYTEQITEYEYLQAIFSKSIGSYKTAAETFLKLYDYKDSAALMRESYYLYGVELISNGMLTDAVLYLNKADNYPGAADLAKHAKYKYCLEHADAPDKTTRSYLKDLVEAGYDGAGDLKKKVEEWKLSFKLKEKSTYEVSLDITFNGGPEDGLDGYKAVLHEKKGTTSSYISSMHVRSGETCNLSLKNAYGNTLSTIKRIDIYDLQGKKIGSYSR